VVRLSSVTLLALIVVALPLPAFSQSCALCYTQAAASTQRFIQALRSGILILVIPPMFMSVGITVMAYRRRFRYKNEPDGGKSGW
jgi:hypothetical protein